MPAKPPKPLPTPCPQAEPDGTFNIYHLELFYYVARYGGITLASHHNPYKVGQPNISLLMRELEETLGGPLFSRSPFGLNPSGRDLYKVLRRLLDDLPSVVRKIKSRATQPQVLRIGTAPVVLREFLPEAMEIIHAQFPGLRFVFQQGLQLQVDNWLYSGQVDVAITVMGRPCPAQYRMEHLLDIPLVLLVAASSPLLSAADLWKAGATRSYELVAPHAEDALTRLFREGLKPLRVEWPCAFEVDSLEAIENLARRKGRVGLYVAVPGRPVPSGFRALPLPRFPAARIGVCWRAGSHPSVDVLVRELRKLARALRGPGKLPTRPAVR